jgi:2-(1,2-epoxy-1,2-dihydrophenyl)acetyl-CoA isomerase
MAMTYERAVSDARQDHAPRVSVQREGTHALVTLDDPDKLNPLSAPLTVQLHDTLKELVGEPSVRAIVLTGRDPAFSAGGDLRLIRETGARLLAESPGGATDVWRWIRHQFGAIVRLITSTHNAFNAAVNCPAARVGLALSLQIEIKKLSER